MSSVSETAAPPPPPPPAPSVFISYASEDRPAARALRDTLTAAGLDVWYDENELGGGDSWDQKIRRQIRDCEYFMPVISATTESRKEGYFRREWRLATDRSLDMADDVLFLLPVSIDGTSENGARVPDKFLTVQWLRAPGGHATPALHHLLRRLLAGEHHALPRSSSGTTRAPFQRTAPPFATPPFSSEPPPLHPPPAPASSHLPPPPPMPAFPHVPEKGGFLHGIKFIAEVFWWALSAAWMLFNRLPRWIRIMLTIWLVFVFVPRCGTTTTTPREEGNRPRPPPRNQSGPPGRGGDGPKNFRAIADRISQAAREGKLSTDPAELAKLGAEISREFSDGLNTGAAPGKQLLLVPFAPPATEEPTEKFADAVFVSLYGRLALEHRGKVGVTPPPRGNQTDDAHLARGKRFGSAYVLTARTSGEDPARMLIVRLLTVADNSTAWTESFPTEGSDPSAVAEKISDGVLAALPKK